MTEYVDKGNLKVSKNLDNLISEKVCHSIDLTPEAFWGKFEEILNKFSPVNKELLEKRESLQKQIDSWHITNKDKNFDKEAYKDFLKEIGYLLDEGDDFSIETENVDPEISTIAGPQLVVPVMNARFALNAANARWGSLYDAVYGTDVIKGEKKIEYDPERGKKVIDYTRAFLDSSIPIDGEQWKNVTKIELEKKNLIFKVGEKKFYLKDKNKFIGYNASNNDLNSILLKNNNLHIDIIIDPSGPVGKNDKAGISDIILESAISTIVDNEDSVAAVDAKDKIKCYRNWLGIMKGNLETTLEKNGKNILRKLNQDRFYTNLDGKKFSLHGRALLLNRNVGHLMTNSCILLSNNSEIPEGIMDAFFSTMCALHDFKIKKNSRSGSFYIVKPKMHGPEEVDFTNDIFSKVEEVLKLKKNTIKVGIMDEERRTTVNLKECIRKVKDRIVFINTGFLDRTGDEMHTSFEAGPMIFKGEMKKSKWLEAYENWNVDVGLSCGFSGVAQIGKGMWAMPDKMSDMMDQKIIHPNSGANCAWVPSPTAATLHAMHYHKIDVFKKQKEYPFRKKAEVTDILEIPKNDRQNWSKESILKEIENNAQSILGYVVRWINHGVGCSKVPDINNVGLMEDRATLRISSQHIANWLHHEICTKDEVIETMKKMASIVDKQNETDPNYQPMSKNFDKSIAFKTACDLVLSGKDQPSGYTEPILHKRRIEK
ncbi:MAG: malate synthase G, partial [Pseudomonadota bacterium]|nr:malate synthase G [Pseudomonadota bacterium]